MYQIHWKSLITRATGKGTGKFPRSEAEQIAHDLNVKYSDIQLVHWVELAEETDEQTDNAATASQ